MHQPIEAGLLLEHIDHGGPRGIRRQSEMEPLVPAVLLGMPGRKAG